MSESDGRSDSEKHACNSDGCGCWTAGVAEGERLESSDDGGRVLPVTFVRAYRLICEAALRQPGSTLGPDTRGLYGSPRVVGPRTSSGRPSVMLEGRAGAKPEKRRGGSGSGVLRSERWLAVKGRVDRKLRKLAREMDQEISLEDAVRSGSSSDSEKEKLNRVVKCGRCKQFGESDWKWCPYDGHQMMEVE
jgi:hypothetical protein